MQTQALLFVDQVDSTRLLAQIGDEAMVSVRRRLHQLMNDSVAGAGGRIFGDMGDGVAAVFETAGDAANAALQMHAEAATTHDSAEPSIELRVGVHFGDVVPNGDGFIGMAVHVTARLCDAAPTGHIAASEAFCAALGIADDLAITPYERRVMKGIATPMEVRLLTRSDSALPLPQSSTQSGRWGIPSTPWLSERATPRMMVGRDDELHTLEALGAASDDRIQLVLVDGEPGIGKTTLLHRYGASLAQQGRLCVVGRADEAQPAPYREFIEALAHIIPHLPDAVIADHVLRHGHILARLIPELRQRSVALELATEGEDEDLERFRLFEAIADLLRSITPNQPVVVLLEDLHWSAEASLALVEHLTRSVHIPSLLLVGSFRTAAALDDSPLASFVGRTSTESNVTRLRLRPLRPLDVQTMVADLPFADVAAQLHEKTSGSPLFLTEMIRSFGEASHPEQAEDGSLLVPDTVQELAARRVDRLGAAHRAVLADAAVLGAVFELTDLEKLAAPHIDVLATLEDAEQAGLVISHPVDDEAYIFGHAVVRDALYERISAPRRRRRHGSAADAILASGDQRIAQQAAEVLRHLELSSGDLSNSDRPPELIARLARSAAANAMDRLDLDDVVRQRTLVVDALRRRDNENAPHRAELVEALLGLGTAETSAGRTHGQVTFVEAASIARSIQRWDLFSEAASRYGGPLKENQAIVDVSEPASLLAEALEHEPNATAMRARLLTALAIWQRQHVPYLERRKLTDEALEIARTLDDKRTLATVLAEVHRALHGPNTTQEALEASEELERLAAELGDDMVALQAVNLRLHVEAELARVDDIRASADRLGQLASRVGTIEGTRVQLLWLATVASARGEADEHRRLSAELSQLLASYPAAVRGIMVGASALMLPWLQGQSSMLYQVVSRTGNPLTMAFLAADSGDLEATVEHLADGGGPEQTLSDQNYMFFHDAFAMTRAARRLGDLALAAKVYEMLLPYSGRNARMGLVSFLGAVDHHLGSLAALLGKVDLAVGHFNAAIAQHRRGLLRPWVALSLAELSVVLRDSGSDARQTEAEARAIADELGLALVIETLDA